MDKETLKEFSKLIDKETPDFYHKRRNEIREILTETCKNESKDTLTQKIQTLLSIEISHLANIISTIIPSKEYNSKTEYLINELGKTVFEQILAEIYKSENRPKVGTARERKITH